MANKLTSYNGITQARQHRADAIRAVREDRLEAYKQTKAPAVVQEPSNQGQGADIGVRALATGGDLAANVFTGALKGLEGIVDFGAGLTPYIGIPQLGIPGMVIGAIIANQHKDDLQEFIKKDWVGTFIGDPLQDLTKDSYLNEAGKAGEIVEGVAQGVGQLLPAVAVTIATGGMGAPSVVAEAASLATTAFSAAGSATEQAFQDGAGYEQGLLYGTAVGAVEAGTEKLLPGLGGLYGKSAAAAAKGLGKSAAKTVGKEVAEVGLKRVAKEAIGEGVEEMISETASPALKTIYKGKDALREYNDADFWGGVLEAGVIGAGTSVAYGGTVGRAMKTTGVYADANSVAEHIKEQKKLRGKAGLSQADRVQIEQNIKADTELLSKRLQRLSEKSRAQVFEKMPIFKAMFDADGTVKGEQAAALDAKIKAAEDTTYDARYRTATLGAETIEKALKNGSTEGHEMRAFSGELSKEQSRALGKVHELMGAVSERSGDALGGFVITETSPKGGAYFDPNTRVVTIGVDTLTDGNASEAVSRALEKDGTLGTIVHEVGHAIEDTNAGKALAKLVTDNKALEHLAITDVLGRGYLQDFFGKDGKKADAKTVADGVKKLIAKENNGEVLTESEQEALDEYRAEVAAFANQRLLGNKSFVKKLITTEPSTAEKLIAKIRELREDLKVRKDPEAKAQLEFVRKAEKLFMQGLSEAGGTIDANGKIHLANREEDDAEALTRENSEKTHDSDSEPVDEKARVRYNRKVPPLNEFATQAMTWSRSDGTEVGEQTTFTKDGQMVIVEKTNDSYEIIKSFEINNRNQYQNVLKKVRKNNETLYGTLRSSIDAYKSVGNEYGTRSGLDVGQQGNDGSNGGVHRIQSRSNGNTTAQRSAKNSGKVKPVHYHFNEDGSTKITYSDGSTKTEPPGAPKKKPVRHSRKLVADDVNVEKAAVALFGRTYRWAETGYITKAGTRLDFSGRHEGASGGYRTVDHRDIVSVYDDLGAENAGGNEAMVDFMARGNVRVMPEGNGINLSVKPTKAQEEMLSDFISKAHGEVYVDLDDTNGNTVVSVEYPQGTRASKVLNDIRQWFDEGIEPQISPLAQFRDVRFSRASTGETVTISKGELAKLHANYAGDKVFAKGAVTEALKGIDALKVLSTERRREIANEIWTGYNKRLHQQGFEMFTELAWHQIHAEILQESGFEMSEDAVRVMDEQIVAALEQIVQSGKPSIKAKLESDTSTEGYRKQAQFWRDEHSKAVEYHKRLNTLKYELEKLANQKKGLYVNAANFRGDSFKVAIDELAKMNWRGGLVSAGKIRERFAKLAAWYTKENPLYKGDGGTGSLFRQEIADVLNSLGNSQNGALTVEDLQAAETVVKYFAHEIEAHNTVFKDGKRVDAMPEAKAYIEKVRRAKEIAAKCGIWSNLMRSKFARMVADPAMLMRQADGYLSGFFTEQYEALRQGTIDAAVLERELSEEFEQFWEKNKAYAKRYNDATVKFGDTEMPLQEAISLYMTMKREHAFAGLAGAGFDIEGKKATEEISAGFVEEVNRQLAEDWKALPPEELLTLTKKKNAEMERAALAKVIEKKREALYAQFTAEDRALIELMERAFEECRDVKVKIDEIVQGYSNVTGGYYYPIKRTGLAENVDAYTGFEGDRVTNLSMNKDTVKNAHKLLIEPAHIVFMRHLKATSLYHGLGVFTDNFNRLYNLNIGSNANNPITVRTALGQSSNFSKEMIKYFKELKQDVEGISKKRSQEKWYNDAVGFIRSSYATYQLGANPKVWVTQLSSLIAATNILDADCIAKGLTVSGKDVDEHCRLAWLRNNDSSAVQAQSVGTSQNAVQRASRNVLQKVRDGSMWMIGRIDRLVIIRLFGACQVQVEKQGGAKVGTKENKIEAGKLLQRVILETQQNSLATERSAAMRSSDELLKGSAMFSADAMKVGARFVDAFCELSVLRTRLREAKKAGDGKAAARLEGEIKRVRTQCVRSTVALVGVALFNAALAYAFKWLYRRDEEENLGSFIADTFGNMLGGIPFVRDLWSFFQDGFEMDHFLISTVNDVLGTAAASFELVSDAASGKEITRQDALAAMRKVLYAAGQLSGVPVRNVYNVTTGLLNRVAPEAGYTVESQFKKRAYASDLKKAIEAGDDGMVGTIAGLMIDEKVGIEDGATRDALRRLTEKGHSVLPRSVGDSVSVNGETVALTGAQQKKLRSVYAIGQDAVADMVKLKQFQSAGDEVQAAAVKFVWDVYWDLSLEDVLGVDLAEKNVLFAEAIPVEKLAVIIAAARAIEADKDKDGKAISGTKKRKIQTFVNSLRLSAAEKYMVMGYLGYSNANGEGAVRAHISKLNLSKGEKEKLLGYSGYGA